MDPGSTTHSLNPAGALDSLATACGAQFPHLYEARALAEDKIEQELREFADVRTEDVSITLFGSWARRELTEGSDNDWAILVPRTRIHDSDVQELAARCRDRFNNDDKAPGRQAVFGVPFGWPSLPNSIGLNADSNTNLTRRMLTLLESVAITGDARDQCWRAIFDRYVPPDVRPFRPPRFLLNDTIRYWRTICVDFEGKKAAGDGKKWGMRNAKLRTSRTILFAGGLLPALFCRLRDQDEIPSFLEQQFAAPPADRIAWAFLQMRLIDEGRRCLGAYDEWIALLQSAANREELDELQPENRDQSAVFQEVREIGHRVQAGLLALLFDSDLGPESRSFLVF